MLGSANEIPPGTSKQVVHDRGAIAVFNVNGHFYAMDGICLHRGGPVGEGDLEGTTVTCPWHGNQYDVTTGELISDRTVGLKTYEVDNHEGELSVDID